MAREKVANVIFSFPVATITVCGCMRVSISLFVNIVLVPVLLGGFMNGLKGRFSPTIER